MCYDRDIFMGYAKKKIKKMNNGNLFTTFDLFNGFEDYDNLSIIDKQNIGKMIKNEVEGNNIKNVLITGNKKRIESNIKKYKK